MSTVDIKFNTTGSIVVKDRPFKPPEVTQIKSKSQLPNKVTQSTIYFPPSFILTNSNISAAVTETSYVTDILTNITLFTKLVVYNNKIHKGAKLANPGDKDRMNTNAKFMKDLWFATKSKIMIDNNEYVIVKSAVDSIKFKKGSPLKYELRISLVVSKETDTISMYKLTCREKRDDINKLWNKLFGTELFDENQTNTNRYFNTPALVRQNIKSKAEPTTADIEKKTRDNMAKNLALMLVAQPQSIIKSSKKSRLPVAQKPIEPVTQKPIEPVTQKPIEPVTQKPVGGSAGGRRTRKFRRTRGRRV